MMVGRSLVPKTKSSLVSLAKQRKFDLINCILEQEDIEQVRGWINVHYASSNAKNPQETASLNDVDKPSNPLHAMMVFRPPKSSVNLIIKRMMDIDPNTVPEEATDGRGRTPLHLACAYKADVTVVRRLLAGMTLIMPAFCRDNDGRLPLHWACMKSPDGAPPKGAIWKRSLSASPKETENILCILSALLKAYPQSLMIRDHDGYTALDLARRNKVDDLIISVLKRETKLFHAPESPYKTVALEDDDDSLEQDLTGKWVTYREETALKQAITGLDADDSTSNFNLRETEYYYDDDSIYADENTSTRSPAQVKRVQSLPEELFTDLVDKFFAASLDGVPS